MEQFQEHHKAIDYIVSNIKDGRLRIGSKLPSERDITETVGISRGSTREAISILRGMGLVESRHGSGNYVANNTEESIKQVVGLMILLGSISVQELLEYRIVISRSVGTALIEKGIDAKTERYLKDLINRMKTATDEEFCVLDREFHLGLINATENTLFTTVMEPVGELYMDMIIDVIMDSSEWDRKVRVPMHENILNSILDKDYPACARYIREHYEYVESRLNRLGRNVII